MHPVSLFPDCLSCFVVEWYHSVLGGKSGPIWFLNYPSFVRAAWERMLLLLLLLSKIAQIFQKQSHVSPLDYEPRTRKQRKSEMYSSFICISERRLPSLE